MATLPKKKAHLDMGKNEIQNAIEHILNSTPMDVVEAQHWYDSVSKRPKYYNGTEVKDYGKEYNAGTGITIDNSNETISVDTTVIATQEDLEDKQDNLIFSTGLTEYEGTITVTDYNKLLKNLSTYYSSIAIGASSEAENHESVAIGYGAKSRYEKGTAIGYGSLAGSIGDYYNSAFGYRASASGTNATALGSNASASGNGAIQIGVGSNSTANTLYVGFRNGKGLTGGEYWNWQLLDGPTGLIPDARLSSNIARTADVPTTASDIDALPDTTKYASSIDLTMDSSTYVITAQLKDQDGNNIGTAKNIDLPFETVVVSGSYNSITKKVVLTLKDGSTVEFSVADLVSGLQTEITSTNKLNSDLVDDTNQTHKFVSSTEKNTWNNKQNALTASNKLNPAYIATDANNRFVSDADKTAWSNKQDALGYTPCKKLTVPNPALTASTGGEVTWPISNTIGVVTVGVHIYEVSGSTYTDVTSSVEIAVTASTITVKMNSTTNVTAGTYQAVIIG